MPLGTIVDHNYAESAFIIARSDRLKPLLPCSVPQLQLYPLIAGCEHFDFEVDADCGHVVLGESVLGKTHQKTGFADAAVPNQNQFDQLVEMSPANSA